ncbi:indole-3-glycerol-phosphate synthase [Candidatus Gottesmanbacteria bacterium]|nr:indole-3-glycerol-phosphate synthase [Candidatus Gottesmanbacteria bacterium]
MKNFLSRIIEIKRKEVEKLKSESCSFKNALVNPKSDGLAIIAEIKLASPVAGLIGKKTDVTNRVTEYELAGVDAISVVVDKTYFQGEYSLIRKIKQNVILPILAKDFIIDPLQIFQSKRMGADAVLLIAKIVNQTKLIELVKLAEELEIDPIVEVDNQNDLERVLKINTDLVAVNARNLDDFSVDIDRACHLIKQIPENRVVLGFSGIRRREDVEKYKAAGARGVLVGTSLMKARNVKKFINKLREPLFKFTGPGF